MAGITRSKVAMSSFHVGIGAGGVPTLRALLIFHRQDLHYEIGGSKPYINCLYVGYRFVRYRRVVPLSVCKKTMGNRGTHFVSTLE